VKRLSLALLVASLAGSALLVGNARASSLSPCGNRVINDWYDNGRIDHTYPIQCYRDALHHLPTDVLQYADAKDVITRAMALAISAKASHQQPPGGGTTTSTSTNQTPTSTTGSNGGSGPGGGSGSNPPGSSSTPSSHPDPLLTKAIKRLGPSNADSIPLPLVVLGALALLLLAAGAAGMVARKLQERRLPATPGGSPPPDAPPSAS
jgi:hypothetical protein